MDGNITILGAGESGVGAALLAQAQGYRVWVSDAGQVAAKYHLELEQAGIEFEEGGHTEEKVLEAELVVKSPGIPEESPIVQRIREEGIELVSEIEFASQYTKAKLIGITGTNGKTTTALLLYHLLKESGLEVALAGNVGDSFARKLLEKDREYFVLEISSFQLDDIKRFRPNIGIILNITPDHLDRYGNDMERYVDAKFRLLENMKANDLFIYNADDEQIAKRLNQGQWPITKEFFTGAFYQNESVIIPGLSMVGEGTSVNEEERITFKALPLLGKHNGMNISAAIIAALRLGLEPSNIQKALSTFKNAPHRLERVGTVNGVVFVNDSKATNVESTYHALESFKEPIVWIAGGVDKGNDYEKLRPLVEKNVKALICLGADNAKLMKALGERVDFSDETDDINEAVAKAYHLSETKDVVLLSPACASFDLFRNYEDRGEQFKEAVAALQGIKF